MHRRDDTHDIAPRCRVMDQLRARSSRPGVIFDANADRYQGDAALTRQLKLPAGAVLVIPKGEQADPFLLRFASDASAFIARNDRFRNQIADHPALSAPGRIIPGRWHVSDIRLDQPPRRSPT